MAPHIGVKIALELARDPERTKRLLTAILIVVLTMAALPAIALLGISALLEQEDNITDEYDITESEVYQITFPVYKEFMDEQTQEMIEQAKEIVKENTKTETYWETETDPATGEEIEVARTREVCMVDVYVICNHMDYAYLMSYFSVHDENVMAGEKYMLKEDDITEFLANIQEIKIEHLGSNYYIYNQFYSTDEIKVIAAGEDETQQEFFLTTFFNYKEFLKGVLEPENYHFGGADEAYRDDVEWGEGGTMEGMPQWYQYSGAWADYPYGGGTISSSGCAIVCLSMVTSYLNGEVVTPLDIVDFTGNRYYQPGAGSTWSIFPAVSSNYGYSCSNLGKNTSALIDALQSGHPVIASMGPGTFTKGGHFIVLKGITEDGKILVNDPNDNDRKNHNNTEFNLNTIITESKNFWSFY